MAKKTAIIIVMKDPEVVAEIFVYHTGNQIYTAKTNNIIGKPNIKAIGKPLVSLLTKLLCAMR